MSSTHHHHYLNHGDPAAAAFGIARFIHSSPCLLQHLMVVSHTHIPREGFSTASGTAYILDLAGSPAFLSTVFGTKQKDLQLVLDSRTE